MQHDQMIFHDALLNFTRNLQHLSRLRISPMRSVSYRPKLVFAAAFLKFNYVLKEKDLL
jgi:hypothetical protein